MDETANTTESADAFLQAFGDNDRLLDDYFDGADVDTVPTTRSSATAIGNVTVRPLSPESLEQLPPRNMDVPPRVAIVPFLPQEHSQEQSQHQQEQSTRDGQDRVQRSSRVSHDRRSLAHQQNQDEKKDPRGDVPPPVAADIVAAATAAEQRPWYSSAPNKRAKKIVSLTVEDLSFKIQELSRENSILTQQTYELQNTVKQHRTQIQTLRGENQVLRQAQKAKDDLEREGLVNVKNQLDQLYQLLRKGSTLRMPSYDAPDGEPSPPVHAPSPQAQAAHEMNTLMVLEATIGSLEYRLMDPKSRQTLIERHHDTSNPDSFTGKWVGGATAPTRLSDITQSSSIWSTSLSSSQTSLSSPVPPAGKDAKWMATSDPPDIGTLGGRKISDGSATPALPERRTSTDVISPTPPQLPAPTIGGDQIRVPKRISSLEPSQKNLTASYIMRTTIPEEKDAYDDDLDDDLDDPVMASGVNSPDLPDDMMMHPRWSQVQPARQHSHGSDLQQSGTSGTTTSTGTSRPIRQSNFVKGVVDRKRSSGAWGRLSSVLFPATNVEDDYLNNEDEYYMDEDLNALNRLDDQLTKSKRFTELSFYYDTILAVPISMAKNNENHHTTRTTVTGTDTDLMMKFSDSDRWSADMSNQALITPPDRQTSLDSKSLAASHTTSPSSSSSLQENPLVTTSSSDATAAGAGAAGGAAITTTTTMMTNNTTLTTTMTTINTIPYWKNENQ